MTDYLLLLVGGGLVASSPYRGPSATWQAKQPGYVTPRSRPSSCAPAHTATERTRTRNTARPGSRVGATTETS